MFYVPGPKARAEYHTFTRSGRTIDASAELARAEVAIAPRQPKRREGTRPKSFAFSSTPSKKTPEPASLAPPPDADDDLIAELHEWGIDEMDARKELAASVGQPARDKIDWAIAQIKQGGIDKPAGFIVSTIRKERPVPPNFECGSRKLRFD
jgi:hypothetical protein